MLLAGAPLQAQVYVMDSPGAAELVASAEDRLSKDEPAEAARLLQRVLDEERSRLLETDDGRYAEASQVAAGILLNDEQLLETYREMYGPTASRQLSQAGSDRARLARVRHRFPATEAALEAGLREAGLALAAGQPAAAAVTLEALGDHPDLDDHRTRYQQLAAAAALLLDNQGGYQQFHDALMQRGEEDAVSYLESFQASLRLPDAEHAFSPLDTLPETPLPDVLAEPLWRYETRGAEEYLTDAYQIDEDRLEAYSEDGRLLNTLFTVADGLVYLNDGFVVAALDASSGMELWKRELTEIENSYQRFPPNNYNQWLPSGMDLNGITVGSDRVAAISGFSAMVTMFGASQQEGRSHLVVLDAATGESQWSHETEDISSDFEEGFWYGQPLIHQDRVYATLRRRQRTQFQDAYVVCLDLHSGEPIWRRHVASTALTDRQSLPAMAHMTLEDGYLYVDSRLGTVARLAASDGTVDWLSMIPIDEEERAETIQKPWHAPAPRLVEAGLVVVDDWGEALYVINPRTGEHEQTIAARDWSRPLYLAAVGDDVLAIGESIERRDGATLERLWRYEVHGDHRGRAAVARNRLFLPAGEDVHVIDLETGEREAQLELSLPATLLTLEGQVLAAGREGLRSYSSWELASRQMQQRIDESPGDARPLMAMAWLAFNTDRHDALLETLDEAIAVSLEASQPATDTSLFEQVMTMVEADRGDEALRQALFERVATLAETVEQEIAYRLALGEFHESRQHFDKAMEQYQALLGEAGYRQQLYQHEDGARQAGLEAQRRMQALIDEHGRELYEPYEAFAARRLEELAEQGDPDPLIDLAESYPMAEVTPEVLRLAARRAADQDRLRQALSLLGQARQLTDDPSHVARIYGLQAELFEDAQQPHRARRVLRTLSVVHPDVTPIRRGEAYSIEDWMSHLAEQPQARGVASLNLPLTGDAQSLPGRVLRPIAQDPYAPPSGSWVFRTPDETITLRSDDDFEELWSVPLDHADAQLLSMDRHRLWFWTPSSQSLRVLSTADGSVIWEDDEIAQKLQAIELRRIEDAAAGGPGVVGRNEALLNRARFERGEVPQETHVAVSDSIAATADTRGRVVVFDSDTGRVQWQQATEIQTATHLTLDGGHLIIAGADSEDVPVIGIYDAADGELLHMLTNSGQQAIRWLDVSEDGVLVYLGGAQIEAFDLGRGQSRWICRPGEELVGDGGAWLGLDRLVVRTRNGDMVWVDLSDGQVAGKLAVRGQLQGHVRAHNDADGWFITSNNSISATDNNGNRLWRDTIEDAVRHLDHVITDEHVVALGALIQGGRGSSTHGRRLYVIDRATGTLTHEQDIEAAQNLINIIATDGRLLLTGPRATAVLTGSP